MSQATLQTELEDLLDVFSEIVHENNRKYTTFIEETFEGELSECGYVDSGLHLTPRNFVANSKLLSATMSSTRPSLAHRISSGSSSSSSYNVDAMDVDSDDSVIKVYVLQSKMEEQTISHLFSLVENLASLPSKHDENTPFMLELCQNVREADVVLTNIRMRRRLERHMPWDLAVSLDGQKICIVLICTFL